MEHISVWSLLLEYGPLGIGVLALATWAVRKDKQQTELYKEFAVLQEKRLSESKDALNMYYDLLNKVNDTLQHLKETIDFLARRDS